MNSLSYLSRQFDVLAASDSDQRAKDNGRQRLPRTQSWSAKSLLFPQANATDGYPASRQATLKRVATSPADFLEMAAASSSSSVIAAAKGTNLSSLAPDAAARTSVSPSAPKSLKRPLTMIAAARTHAQASSSPPPMASSSSSSTTLQTLRSVFRRMFFIRIFMLIWDALYAGWQTLTTAPSIPNSPSSSVSGSQRIRRKRKISVQISVTSADSLTTTTSSSQSTSSSSSDVESQSNPPISSSIRLLSLGRHHTDGELAQMDSSLHPPSSFLPLSQLVALREPSLTPPPHLYASPTSRSPTPTSRKSSIHLPKTLVLDLDETLIHSTSRPISYSPHASFTGNFLGGLFLRNRNRNRTAGHTVEVILGGKRTVYHVYKRPFVDFFLRTVSGWYTLVIFTASMQEYADPVIDWLDAGRGILARRFFRDSCTQLPNGSYTKDLAVIEPDLARVCLVDNSPVSYRINECNGIPIEGWTHDPSDEALLDLLPVLDSLRFTSDVRRVLGIRGFS